MKILLVNKFLYPVGGDPISTLATGQLLSEKGHEVIFWGMKHPRNSAFPYQDYFVDEIDFERPLGWIQKIKTAFSLLYSLEAQKKLAALLKKDRPDLAHLNNFAHQISPSILRTLKDFKIPMVMTLHNYKLICATQRLFLRGQPCERCAQSKHFHCFLSRCTKNSYTKSLLNAMEMYLHHRLLHLYDLINVFISPSLFLMKKFVQMGFKKEIVYLPGFVNLSEFVPEVNYQEDSIVYFGRLSEEKGLFTLIKAVKNIPDIFLKIIGVGPLKVELNNFLSKEKISNVVLLGFIKEEAKMYDEIKKSRLVVVPSEWYENNPRVVLEAIVLGKPVIGSRIGGIPELIKDDFNGYTFEAGNIADLKEKIEFLFNNPEKIKQLGQNALEFVRQNFNQEKHYQKLMEIYRSVLGK